MIKNRPGLRAEKYKIVHERLSHNKRRLNPMFPSLLQIMAENLSRLRANPLR